MSLLNTKKNPNGKARLESNFFLPNIKNVKIWWFCQILLYQNISSKLSGHFSQIDLLTTFSFMRKEIVDKNGNIVIGK